MAEVLQPYLGEEAVDRGLRSISEKFRAADLEGPTWVATFMGGDPAAEARIRLDAFMTVSEVLRILGLPSP